MKYQKLLPMLGLITMTAISGLAHAQTPNTTISLRISELVELVPASGIRYATLTLRGADGAGRVHLFCDTRQSPVGLSLNTVDYLREELDFKKVLGLNSYQSCWKLLQELSQQIQKGSSDRQLVIKFDQSVTIE